MKCGEEGEEGEKQVVEAVQKNCGGPPPPPPARNSRMTWSRQSASSRGRSGSSPGGRPVAEQLGWTVRVTGPVTRNVTCVGVKMLHKCGLRVAPATV